jgi:hypothetical protein
MRRMTTILSVLLAAAPVVSAQPWYGNPPVQKDQRDRGVDEGYRRGEQGFRPYQRFNEPGDWRLVLDRYATSGNRQFIPLGWHFGRFSRLRIEGAEGQPFVHKVAVFFMDGSEQVIDIERPLPAGTGVIVNLNGGLRGIRRLVVYTQPDYQSSYTIMGE